jgi:diadenosine tetraphosphate (Ap4A) HIT family hydrolase
MAETIDGCLTCDTLTGKVSPPGGLVADSGLWLADHCLGPFGVGAFVAKTRFHQPSLWELSDEESAAMGPFLSALSGAIVDALDAERVYLSMWVDAPPHHVHLVLEPRYRGRAEAGGAKASLLQEWRRRQGPPDPTASAAAAEKVREALARRRPSYAPR